MSRLSLTFVLLSAVACHRGGTTGQLAAPLSRGVAARFGDQTITVAELDEKVAADIFELRSSVLRIVLVEKLIAQEAQRRGITGLELRRLEVEQKVAMPTEEEGSRALQGWLDEGKINAAEASNTTPAQAAQRLRTIRMRAREEEYYDELSRAAAVQIDFRALGKPDLKISEHGPTLGASGASVRIIEFADLAKPYTSLWQPTLEQLVAKYGRDVNFLFKQKPGEAGSPGATLAEAALCAHKQGRYWDYRRALLSKPEKGRVDTRLAVAREVNLDVAAFERCMDSGETRPAVARDQGEVVANRLDGDPVLSINGIVLNGAQPFPAIDRLLRVEMTGSP